MAQIPATLVKELRERTGSGMMECKRALQETGGDLDAAVEQMRKSGLAKADKKAGRLAAEGVIVIRTAPGAAAMAEVNCETDFVAKGEAFQAFAEVVVERALAEDPADPQALLALSAGEISIEEARRELVAKLGENISVRRFTRMSGALGHYLHSNRRIGVLVELSDAEPELARDIAMHIAASRPLCVHPDQVPPEMLAKEREIFAAQAAQSGKPAHIIDKMVMGRLNKYLAEVTLLGQPFVKDPERSVEQLLKDAGVQVLRFERFELGEGLEKKTGSFVDEVMAQARGDEPQS